MEFDRGQYNFLVHDCKITFEPNIARPGAFELHAALAIFGRIKSSSHGIEITSSPCFDSPVVTTTLLVTSPTDPNALAAARRGLSRTQTPNRTVPNQSSTAQAQPNSCHREKLCVVVVVGGGMSKRPRVDPSSSASAHKRQYGTGTPRVAPPRAPVPTPTSRPRPASWAGEARRNIAAARRLTRGWGFGWQGRRRLVWRAAGAGVLGGAEQRAAGGGPLQAYSTRSNQTLEERESTSRSSTTTLISICPPYHTPYLFDSLMK